LLIEQYFEDILILNQNNHSSYSHAFHIALNSLEDINNIEPYSKVHIKVDTGMHRNGILPNQVKEAILGLHKRNIEISAAFTHHRSADNLSCDFFWQSSVFRAVKEDVKSICEELSIPIPCFHSANSSALFRHKNFNEDFARVGIAMYGYFD